MVKTLRVFEAFAGYGSQRMALDNLGIKHEVVATSEVDEYAILSYGAIHGSNLDKELPESEEDIKEYLTKLNVPLTDKGKLKNLRGKRLRRVYNALDQSNGLGDISKIDVNEVPDHDLFTYSFPCQDISVAGNQGGFEKDSGTRSGLLWECQRIISAKRPKYLLMENVKNLVGKRFKSGFDEWQEYLTSIGYTNYWEVLNAKDFGIPQNRERVFMVSILGEHEPYVFPKPIKLEKRLKDVLEDEVDEKYYLDNERAQQLIATMTDSNEIGYVPYKKDGKQHQSNTVYNPNKFSPALTAVDYKEPKKILEPEIKQVLQYNSENRENTQRFRTYDPSGIAPTLNTMQGGGLEPHIPVEGIPIKNNTEQGYLIAKEGEGDGVDLAYPTSNTRRGRVQESMSQTLTTDDSKGVIEKVGNIYPSGGQNGNVYETKGISPTISSGSTSTKGNGGIGSNNAPEVLSNYHIRKLTPLECFRLMGVTDEDFYKAQAVNSNSQLYKQAGNSIVVPVLEAIFRNMFLEATEEDLVGEHIAIISEEVPV